MNSYVEMKGYINPTSKIFHLFYRLVSYRLIRTLYHRFACVKQLYPLAKLEKHKYIPPKMLKPLLVHADCVLVILQKNKLSFIQVRQITISLYVRLDSDFVTQLE